MSDTPKETPSTDGEIEIGTSEEAAIRKARKAAVDGGDGAHGGGLGASGSAVDFGKPANYSGIDDKGL